MCISNCLSFFKKKPKPDFFLPKVPNLRYTFLKGTTLDNDFLRIETLSLNCFDIQESSWFAILCKNSMVFRKCLSHMHYDE